MREVRAGAPGDPPVASGVCRVRGETWVLLAPADGLEQRVEVLAQRAKSHAGGRLEGRYLPPAVRARLAKEPGSGLTPAQGVLILKGSRGVSQGANSIGR